MERRSFLKFLGASVVAPKIAIEVLSKIKVPEKGINVEEFEARLKKAYGSSIQELFQRQNMAYDIFLEAHKINASQVTGYHYNI